MIEHGLTMRSLSNEVLEELGREQINMHGAIGTGTSGLKGASAATGSKSFLATATGGINTASVTILKGFGISAATMNPIVSSTIVIGGFMLAGYGLYKLNEKMLDKIV